MLGSIKNLGTEVFVCLEEGYIDLVNAEPDQIDITRSEEGFLQYGLRQDKENPAHFGDLLPFRQDSL